MAENPTDAMSRQAARQAVHLLGDVQRVRTRVRGFAPWSPEKGTLALLDQVQAVLGEYADHLPLTIRQIFYRLVGAHDFEKSARAYQRLIEHLNRARRARIISMDVIRDDVGVIAEPDSWESVQQFWATIRAMASRFELDHSAGQRTRLVVICEAAGMVPQLERVAAPFGVTVMSGGGFDSLTDKHKFAAALASHGRPTVVLHIGDHDHIRRLDVPGISRGRRGFCPRAWRPSDLHPACRDTAADRGAPATDAPPKATDNRAFSGETCQAEALPPDVLASILRTAIEKRVDQRVLARVLRQERRIRRELSKRFAQREATR